MQTAPLRPSRPWLDLLIRPRATLRAVLESGFPSGVTLLLAMLSGIGAGFSAALLLRAGDALPLAALLLLIVALGAVFGILRLYLSGWLFQWIGKWLGGTASQAEVRAALAWSALPVIYGLPLWIPRLGLLGETVFRSTARQGGMPSILLAADLAFSFADLMAGMWGFGLWVVCLAEVHRFSVGRALVTMLLGALLLAGVVGALVGLTLTLLPVLVFLWMLVTSILG